MPQAVPGRPTQREFNVKIAEKEKARENKADMDRERGGGRDRQIERLRLRELYLS